MKLIFGFKNRFRFFLTSLLQFKPSRCYDTAWLKRKSFGSDLARESPALQLTVPENGSMMTHPITIT